MTSCYNPGTCFTCINSLTLTIMLDTHCSFSCFTVRATEGTQRLNNMSQATCYHLLISNLQSLDSDICSLVVEPVP